MEENVNVKRLVFLALVMVGLAGIFGCGQVREDEGSKPWAEPEPWERNLGLGPFNQEPL